MPVSLFKIIAASLFGAVLLSGPALAASLRAELVDAQGKPVSDAVLTLNGPLGAPSPAPIAVMDQVQQQFLPNVLAVRSGTKVVFPNSDNIRHQVYSFSPTKRFELRLYQGTPSEPVVFDKPGVVVLGCNIHDWMVGYVYVTDDAWFAVADKSGALTLDVPAGRYSVTLWHPQSPDLLPQSAGELEVPAQGLQQRFPLTLNEAAAPASSGPASSPFGDAFKKAASETPH